MMRKWFLLSVALALSACATVPVAAPHHGFTAEQEGVLRANGFTQNGDDWEFGLADRMLFATNESKLVPAQEVALGHTAHALAKVGILGARVEGHTDITGTAAYNEALSVRRAQSVADALAGGGMIPRLLVVSGLGKANPVQSNATVAGRRENRRVVIIVSAPAQPLSVKTP
jgi:OOP family OmpA-OmpF porin